MKKILVGLAVVTFLVTGLVIPSRGLAQQPSVDIAALQAQIQALLAMIQQLQNQLNALSSGSTPRGGPVVIEVGQVDRATRLRTGDRVQAKDYLRVRSNPSVSSTHLMTVAPGTKGTMASNLKWDGTYWWAEVYWDNRTRGYSVDDYLQFFQMELSGICGDLNGDGIVNVQDTIWMQLYVFQNAPIPTGVNADMNADGRVDILDKTLLEAYALRGGPAPSCKNDQSLVLPSFKSPSAGEQWQAGMTHRFTWGGGDPNQQFLLAIETGVREYFLPAGRPLSVSEIGYNWSIPVNFAPGTYRVVLFAPNDTLTLSDNVVIAEQHFVVVPGVFVPDYSMCGDANGDRSITIVDQDQIRRVAFGGLILPAGAKTDLNGDGVVNILDVTLITNYLNQGGAAPTCAATGNLPPINLSIAGPANVAGMPSPFWDFKATDPEGGKLTYTINWGDGTPNLIGLNISSGESWRFNYHTYSSPGTRTITFTATDDKVLSSNIIFAVTLGEPTSTTPGSPSITVLYPNGGENWLVNTQRTIQWQTDFSGQLYLYFLEKDANGVWTPANKLTNGIGSSPSLYSSYIASASHIHIGQRKIRLSNNPNEVKGDCLDPNVSNPNSDCPMPPGTVYVYDDSEPFNVIANPNSICGDIDENRVVDQNDLNNPASDDDITGYVFGGVPIPAGLKVDLNGDGYPDILDVTILTNYLKRGGPAPTCGVTPPSTGTPAASVLDSIGSQLNSISQTLNNLLNQIGL